MELFGEDVADAAGGAATAGVLAVFVEVVTVIKGNLLAGPDGADGHDPEAAVLQFGRAVGGAAMVGKAGLLRYNT